MHSPAEVTLLFTFETVIFDHLYPDLRTRGIPNPLLRYRDRRSPLARASNERGRNAKARWQSPKVRPRPRRVEETPTNER